MRSELVYEVCPDTLLSVLDKGVRERMDAREITFWDSFRRQVSAEYGTAQDAALSEPFEPSVTLAEMLNRALSSFGGYRYAEFIRARLLFFRSCN